MKQKDKSMPQKPKVVPVKDAPSRNIVRVGKRVVELPKTDELSVVEA